MNDAGNAVVAVGPILVQVRQGELTPEVIDRIAEIGTLIRAVNRGRLGFLAVIEPEAPTPSEAATSRQREVIMRFSERRVAPVAVVNVTESAQAMVGRIRSREYARRGASLHFTDDLEDAAAWLAAEVEGVDPDAVLAGVAEARRQLGAG